MDALSELCLTRLGFDPADLSEDQLRERLPEISEAIRARILEVISLQRQAVAIAKSALAHHRAQCEYIPNALLVRDESVDTASFEYRRTSLVDSDPNAVLESVLPPL